MGWSETEVKAAVRAYFELFEAQQNRQAKNKAALYRELSAEFPERSPNAFELKFQNISAILYEQQLPYCEGLKPKANYQRLLKLLVLDHLDRTPLPAAEPHQILFSKLRELHAKGPVPVDGTSSGRYGLAVEKALGIPQNSSKAPDFMGIELKTKGGDSLQTLFSRTPSRYVQDSDKTEMFDRNSYFDSKRNRQALYTSFSSSPDSLGFYLKAGSQTVTAFRDRVAVVEYEAERLEEALLSKHTQTVFLAVTPGRTNGNEICTIDEVLFCKWPSIIRFLRLIRAGNVFLDFTMSRRNDGLVKDHGFLWRIRSKSLPDLYLSSESMSFDAT